MIIGNIKDAKRYFGINENFEKTFEFLKTLNANSKGEFEFEGFKGHISDFFETSDISDGKEKLFEAHRDYLDIHYCIEGSEGIGYANIDTLTPETEYDSENDYLLLRGKANKIVLNKGDFCIVFPEDAHIPAMHGDEDTVKKAVVKILVDNFC